MQRSSESYLSALLPTESFAEGLEIFQLTPGTVVPSFRHHAAANSSLHFQKFAQGVEIRFRVPEPEVVVATIVESHGPVVQNGTLWRQNEVIAFLNGPVDLCTQAACTVAWLRTDRQALALNTRQSAGPEPRALSFQNAAGPIGTSPAEHALVHKAIHDTARGLRWAKACPETGNRRHEFARRVEELMWQHIDTLLSLKTISKLTARSTRSVHYAFTSSFGFGPLTYFKILRLNAVRKALCDARQKTAIIDIAAEYGFWHLGHFGTSYKEFFGETPSQTRQRAFAEPLATS
jgi:AraC-like DNA-binding protein